MQSFDTNMQAVQILLWLLCWDKLTHLQYTKNNNKIQKAYEKNTFFVACQTL